MRRRNRKHRKSNHQENHIRTIVTKAGNADDMPCGRNLRHFNAKSEPISSSQFNLNVKNKKAPKNHAKRKEKRNGKTQEPITDWLENNLLESNIYVSFPSAKMTSVAYFIPFEIDYYPDFNDNNLNNVMDWNRLIFYGSNSSSMISHYKNKRKNSTQDKSMVLEFPPQLRKSRSSSESSINSDDSFICFEITDDFDNDDEIRYAEDISDKNYPIDTPDIPATTPDPEPTSKKRKRVRFAENSELATVHVIIAWDFAYRAARISPWETAARDANRFKLKIQSIEPIIAPVLDPEHRSKIWYDRMEKFYK